MSRKEKSRFFVFLNSKHMWNISAKFLAWFLAQNLALLVLSQSVLDPVQKHDGLNAFVNFMPQLNLFTFLGISRIYNPCWNSKCNACWTQTLSHVSATLFFHWILVHDGCVVIQMKKHDPTNRFTLRLQIILASKPHKNFLAAVLA